MRQVAVSLSRLVRCFGFLDVQMFITSVSLNW